MRSAPPTSPAGADLIELGVPFSDPLADGPVIHAAGIRALEAGVTLEDVLGLGAELAASVPVVLMVYVNVVLAAGPEAFAGRLAAAGISGLIVPDLPAEEAAPVRAACDAAASRSSRSWRRRRRRSACGRSAATRAGSSTWSRWPGPPGSARAATCRAAGPRAEATDLPVALGFGIGTPERAAEAAAAGARGVIVGSRLVRAAGEARTSRRSSVRSPTRSTRIDRLMGLILAVTTGLLVWIVLWSLGAKGFDAFMITIVIALVGATMRMLAPHLPGRRR